MVDIRKVLKIAEQSGEYVLYFTAHANADTNPVRQPLSGDYCTPYFFKAGSLDDAVRQRENLISVFDEAEIINPSHEAVYLQSYETIHLKAPPAPPEERIRKSATALLEMIYPQDVKDNMQTAFTEGRYKDVLDIAATYDVLSRENLDSKITQIPNPDFELIKGNVIEVTSGSLDRKVVSPYLFKADGIEDTFTSAAEAVVAYKNKNNIKIPDTSKHQIKKRHVASDEVVSEEMTNE